MIRELMAIKDVGEMEHLREGIYGNDFPHNSVGLYQYYLSERKKQFVFPYLQFPKHFNLNKQMVSKL